MSTRLAALTLGHLLTDVYTSFLAPLLPLLVPKFGLSLTVTGLLSATLSITSSITQPVVGYFADTLETRAFVVLGPAITAISMSMIGLSKSPTMLIALLIMGGIGGGMFHPQGASMAGSIDPDRKGLMLSTFTTAGEIGCALAPLIVLTIVSVLGLEYTYVAALPGIIAAAVLYFFASPAGQRHADFPAGAGGGRGRISAGPLALLWAIASLRMCVYTGFITFLPLYLREMGLPLMASGSGTSLFMLAGTAGVMVAGPLADRMGASKLLMAALILPIPLLFGFLSTRGAISYILLAAGAFILYSPGPVIVLAAQDLAPNRAGMASALMMGVAWGAGSLGLIGVGTLADAFGIRLALSSLLVVLAAAAVAAYFLKSLLARNQTV